MTQQPGDTSGAEREGAIPARPLNPDGQVDGSVPMRREQILEAYRLMVQSRAIDELAIKLQRLKRVGLYAPVHGQEAAVVGSAMALDPRRDWMVPASREQPAMIRHGLPLINFFAGYMGRLDYAGIPEDVKLLPRQQAIGAQLPHAAGLAWAMKLLHERAAVMVYCGDGASSEGDFHESLNLAGVMHVPLVVVVINNQYAISTPFHKQTAARSLASRAIGYGIPGIDVDGDDLFAVYSASDEAVRRALEGGGPTLLECRTYRVGFHNTSDNPNDYRHQTEVTAALANDPLARVERYVVTQGLLSTGGVAALKEEIRVELDAAQRAASELPRPDADFIFQNVYAVLPYRIEQQRAETAKEDRR
jgi:TPP-dependent pyruvate/acetoin dehydrogenase alpha subunit